MICYNNNNNNDNKIYSSYSYNFTKQQNNKHIKITEMRSKCYYYQVVEQ